MLPLGLQHRILFVLIIAFGRLTQTTNMASSSPPASPLEERQEHENAIDREATEMGHYDEVLRRSSLYVNASAQPPPASNSTPNGTYFSYIWRLLANSWQRQISPIVPHDARRDHFGTPVFLSQG